MGLVEDINHADVILDLQKFVFQFGVLKLVDFGTLTTINVR